MGLDGFLTLITRESAFSLPLKVTEPQHKRSVIQQPQMVANDCISVKESGERLGEKMGGCGEG